MRPEFTGVPVTVTVSVLTPQLQSLSSWSTVTWRRTVSPGAKGSFGSPPAVIT